MELAGYSLDVDPTEYPELVAASWLESRILGKTFADERHYKAHQIIYADAEWFGLFATTQGRIYKIGLQFLHDEPLAVVTVIVRAEQEIRSRLNVNWEDWGGVGEGEAGKIWKFDWGDITLATGRKNGTGFAHFVLTRRNFTKPTKEPQEQWYLTGCPDCKQQVRVPAGRGSIRIHCPRCTCQFVRET